MLPLILGAAGVGGLIYLATRGSSTPKTTASVPATTPTTTTAKPPPVVVAPPPTSSPTSLPVPIIPDPTIPVPVPIPSTTSFPTIPGITTTGFQNQAAVVATEKDPLNVRSGPTTAAGVIGQVAKGSAVTVTSPKIAGTGSSSGWVSIIQGNIKGFVSNDFLMYPGLAQSLPSSAPSSIPDISQQLPPVPSPVITLPPDIISVMTSNTPIIAAAIPATRQALVTTATDPLNVRSLPSSSGSIMGKVAKGSKVSITNGGTPIAGAGSTKGWLPITQGSIMGFASADYLTLI